MPQSTALAIATQFRNALLRRERVASARLVRLYGSAHRRILDALNVLVEQIELARAQGLTVSSGWLLQQENYQALLRVIDGEMTAFAGALPRVVGPGTYDAVAIALEESKALAGATLAPLPPALRVALMARWSTPHLEAVKAAMGFLAPNSPVWSVLEGFGPSMQRQIEEIAINGILRGWNPRRWARELRQVTGRGLDWAMNWSRTLQMNAYREATRWSYMQNQHVIRGWRWHSALDNRTCMGCVAMHGTVHPVSEPLNDHHMGRCVALPITPTYAELGLAVEEEPLRHQTGDEWFNGLDEATQRKMMGPGKYDAWRDGRFKIPDMATEYIDPVWGTMRHEAALKRLVGGMQ